MAFKILKGGYHGWLLRVNLTNGKVTKEEIPEKTLINFIGGRGLGSKLLYDEVPATTDPLSAKNTIYFVTGPSHGSNAITTSRFAVVSKSPLTNTIMSCISGGHYGLVLKSTGFDVVAIEGIAKSPCYIYVDGQNVEIRDASVLWGKDTASTSDELISKTNPKAAVACIGPAGENLSPLACIINDKKHATGRGGLGAVMGSKNLKALVVSGDAKTPFTYPEKVEEARKYWQLFSGEATLTKDTLKEYGTPALVKVINSFGAFPTNNFQQGFFVDVESISGEAFKEVYYQKSEPCRGCTIGCSHLTKTKTRSGKGPEFESLWALGALCGINDFENIINASYNCNEFGMDTISTGSTIACAMELAEKGLLDEEAMKIIRHDLGKDLRFGDMDAIVKLTELIGKNEGFGKILTMGSKRLAEKYGHPEYAMHSKGLELPAYDARGFNGMTIAYATSNRGGCHLRAYLIGPEGLATPFAVNRFETAGKAELTKLYQENAAVVDSLVACIFTSFALNPDIYARLLSAITGIEMDGKALLKSGERIWNLEKMFNLKAGLTRKDDSLPSRILNEPLKAGHSKDVLVKLEPLLDEYYTLRGWDLEGIPTKEKLAELELTE
jgi:aldehyde:ferredoxin oxidoreductase